MTSFLVPSNTRRTVLGLFYGLVVLSSSGCGKTTITGDPQTLSIVTTFSIPADWAREIGGSRVRVFSLAGIDGDPHTFEPSPDDVLRLSKANLVVSMGAGLEGWLGKVIQNSGFQGKLVVLAEGISLREGKCNHSKVERDHPEHSHEMDPHVWHDLQNVMTMVPRIQDALCEIDPAFSREYQLNCARYLAALKDLDSWTTTQISSIPASKRKLVTNHDTFGYFADRYGLKVAGTLLQSVSTESAEPSASEFVNLVKEVKKAGVSAIFAENTSNPKLMERLAAESGVRLGPKLYTDALGAPGSSGDSFVSMFRHNVTSITESLSK